MSEISCVFPPAHFKNGFAHFSIIILLSLSIELDSRVAYLLTPSTSYALFIILTPAPKKITPKSVGAAFFQPETS